MQLLEERLTGNFTIKISFNIETKDWRHLGSSCFIGEEGVELLKLVGLCAGRLVARSKELRAHAFLRVTQVESGPVHTNAFSFENAYFFIRFRLPSTLIR